MSSCGALLITACLVVVFAIVRIIELQRHLEDARDTNRLLTREVLQLRDMVRREPPL